MEIVSHPDMRYVLTTVSSFFTMHSWIPSLHPHNPTNDINLPLPPRTPEDAGSYVRALRALLRAVGASDGNMDEGSLRCDVNVSVNREGEPFGTRCEVKNINSVRFLMSAIRASLLSLCSRLRAGNTETDSDVALGLEVCEIHRQTALLSSGQKVAQETRGYDEDSVQTYSLRSKEDAVDYRYMPDPNLGVLKLSEVSVSALRFAY